MAKAGFYLGITRYFTFGFLAGHDGLVSMTCLTLDYLLSVYFYQRILVIACCLSIQYGCTAADIAWINSIGNLGGFIGPEIMGRVRIATDPNEAALMTLSAVEKQDEQVSGRFNHPSQGVTSSRRACYCAGR